MTHEGDGSLNAVFEEVPITVFPLPSIGQVVTIKSDENIVDAVKTLSKFHILSAPVRDASKGDDESWSEKYLGMLDMSSVVVHMLDKLLPEGQEPQDFAAELEAHQAFKDTTVADAAAFATFGPFVPVDVVNGNLLDCMLLCGLHGLRRVPVVDSLAREVKNVVTQSALVQTLAANLPRFASVGKKTLAELGLGAQQNLFTVKSTQPLVDAFKIMRENDISAVPVLDDAGVLVGNISARDVRYIIASSKLYKLLRMPIKTYLEVVTDGRSHSAISCQADATLEDVIKQLVESRIHRIYVIDGDNKPIRVVALRDILMQFVKEPQGYFGHYFG